MVFVLLELDLKRVEVEVEGDFGFGDFGMDDLQGRALLQLLEVAVEGHVEIVQVLLFYLV